MPICKSAAVRRHGAQKLCPRLNHQWWTRPQNTWTPSLGPATKECVVAITLKHHDLRPVATDSYNHSDIQWVPMITGSHSLMKSTEPHHLQRAEMQSWGHYTDTLHTLTAPSDSGHENHKLNQWQGTVLSVCWEHVWPPTENTDTALTTVLHHGSSGLSIIVLQRVLLVNPGMPKETKSTSKIRTPNWPVIIIVVITWYICDPSVYVCVCVHVCVCIPAEVSMNSQTFSLHRNFSIKLCFLQEDQGWEWKK